VTPSNGQAAGGTSVVVSGTGFLQQDALYCQFGATKASAVFRTSTLVSCTAPSGTAGSSVTVSVSNNNADFTSEVVTYSWAGAL
jgi:hypothetical protein